MKNLIANQSEMTVKSALRMIDEGNVLEDEGQLDEALQRYDAAILLAPRLARAYLNRGNALLAMDKAGDALNAFATALSLDPDYAAAHYNRGNACARLGQNEAALKCYRKAISLRPDFVDAEVAIGCVLEDLGQFEDAAVCYRRALEIKPDYAEVYGNLGKVLYHLEQFDDAVASYRRAVEIIPDSAEMHFALGGTLLDSGQTEAAIVSFQRVLEIDPDSVIALINLGNIQRELGQPEAAVANYRRALEIDPNFVLALHNLANTLRELGQYDAAVANYRRALEIKPDNAEVHNDLALALYEIAPLDAVMTSLRRALAINPDFALAHRNLAVTLKDLGQLDDAVVSCRRALEIEPDLIEAQDILLFIHNFLANQPASVMLADAVRYGEMVARKACTFTTWNNTPDPTRCLRIGLVSGDLRQHPVGNFLEGVLAALAAETSKKLTFFAYPSYSIVDEVTERIKSHCHGWHSAVKLSDKMLAQRVRDDGIDILIDLSGHSAYNRLSMFAWKPAPVQVSWLGYFATTGVTAIDYLIADPWTLPESEEVNFTEKIWRLPETRLCFTAPNVTLENTPLPALSNGFLTFACFNNLTKMNDTVVALWAKVLASVPASRLFLKSKQLTEASVRQSVMNRFIAHGINIERLILEGPSPRTEYLATYQRVDIALDPFPFTGGTTTVEALWMGVPVLTLAGQSFLARQGVGLMMNAGLPEWIAVDPDDYVARAVSHAGNLPALAALRTDLRQQVLASPIFDASRFARHFEDAMRGMWQDWCEKQQGKTA